MCLFGMFDRPTPKRRHKKIRTETSPNHYTYRNQPPPRQYKPIPRAPLRDLQPNTAHLPRRVRKHSLLHDPNLPTPQKPPQHPPARTRTRTTNTIRPPTSRPYSSHQKAPQIRHLTSNLLQRQTLDTRRGVLDTLLPKYQYQDSRRGSYQPPPPPSSKRQRRSTLPSFPPPPSSSSSSTSSSSSAYDRGAFSPRPRASTISSPSSSVSSWGNGVPIIQTYVQPPVLPLFERYRPVGLGAYTDSEESMGLGGRGLAGRGRGTYYDPSTSRNPSGSRYRNPSLFSSNGLTSFATSLSAGNSGSRDSRGSGGGGGARASTLHAIRNTRDATAREMDRLDAETQRMRRTGRGGGGSSERERSSGRGRGVGRGRADGFWGWE